MEISAMEQWWELWLFVSLWKLWLYDASRSSSMIMGVKLITSGIFPLVKLTSALLNPLSSWLSSKYSECCNKVRFFWSTMAIFPTLLSSNSQSPLTANDLKRDNNGNVLNHLVLILVKSTTQKLTESIFVVQPNRIRFFASHRRQRCFPFSFSSKSHI